MKFLSTIRKEILLIRMEIVIQKQLADSNNNGINRFYILRQMAQERAEIAEAWLRWEDQDWMYEKK